MGQQFINAQQQCTVQFGLSEFDGCRGAVQEKSRTFIKNTYRPPVRATVDRSYSRSGSAQILIQAEKPVITGDDSSS